MSSIPRLNLQLKSGRFTSLWLKYVTGYDMHRQGEKCLLGVNSVALCGLPRGTFRLNAGEIARPLLSESQWRYVYLCGTTKDDKVQVHLAMEFWNGGTVVLDDEDIRVMGSSLRQVQPGSVPGAESVLPGPIWRCPIWRFGWTVFPECRKPLAGHPQFRQLMTQQQPASLDVFHTPGEPMTDTSLDLF